MNAAKTVPPKYLDPNPQAMSTDSESDRRGARIRLSLSGTGRPVVPGLQPNGAILGCDLDDVRCLLAYASGRIPRWQRPSSPIECFEDVLVLPRVQADDDSRCGSPILDAFLDSVFSSSPVLRGMNLTERSWAQDTAANKWIKGSLPENHRSRIDVLTSLTVSGLPSFGQPCVREVHSARRDLRRSRSPQPRRVPGNNNHPLGFMVRRTPASACRGQR